MRPIVRLAIACCGSAALSGCIGLSIGGRTIQQTCPDLEARMAQLESRVNGLEKSVNPPAVLMLPAEQNFVAPVPLESPLPQAMP
ncbi:hypothetical protein [Planctellipticum variicoloris]|uniref:hypothetical protein n=1 Tax=Planctellipticum variicoloris TaxID=3064265 RepID=UPI0030133237|nr:hypothetical protein SH412_002473 [Planctomycetaceae bacterium SH412]